MIISDSISFPKNIFLSFIHKNNTAQSGQSESRLPYLCEVEILALQIQPCFMWLLRSSKHYIINNQGRSFLMAVLHSIVLAREPFCC